MERAPIREHKKAMAANQPIDGLPSTSRPPNPNSGDLHPQPSRTGSISHQPSPAIVASASHSSNHVLPRRFIGAIPESAANSAEALEKHQRLKTVRSAAIKRISEVQGVGRRGTRAIGDKRRSIERSIKIKRTGKSGEEFEQEIRIEGSSDEEDQIEVGWFGMGKKGKQRRKDVWVGESFDIGREFRSAPPSPQNEREAVREVGESETNAIAGPSRPTRPVSSSRQTTADTFVTARTHVSSAKSIAESEVSMTALVGGSKQPEPNTARSVASAPTILPNRNSQSSSMEPLMTPANPASPTLSSKSKGKLRSLYPDLSNSKSVPNLRNRLKSAIRRPSGADQSFSEIGRAPTVRGKSKTVQFPVDLEHHIQETALPTKGNKAPADPGEVLSREGEDAAGTSAGAVEEAMEDVEEEEEEEDPILPGEVIMRGESTIGG